jgi:hypothetical protein
MSTTYSANQREATFRPTALGNWAVPKDDNCCEGGTGRDMSFICDDKGHLIKRSPASPSSFAGVNSEFTRWPQSPHPPRTGNATMGYKGIQTGYLPTSTVYVRNNPGPRAPHSLCPRRVAR